MVEWYVYLGNKKMSQNFKITKKENFVQIESLEPTNIIAPSWKFNLWLYSIDSSFIQELKILLEQEEKNIIEKYPSFNDGGTGLGPDTVTSRYNNFNLFRIEDLRITKLKQIIKNNLQNFLTELEFVSTPDFNPRINCWYNIMKPGQSINVHTHNLTNTSFISGHVTVACEDSYTYYITPYTKDKLEFVNNLGEGIFFPSYIEHGTSKHVGSLNRMTLAFDIYYNENHANENIRNNLVSLYD
jgi:hypothetical protein